MSGRSWAFLATSLVTVGVLACLGWRAATRSADIAQAAPAARLREELRRTPYARHQEVFARYLPLLGAKGLLDEVEAENTFCHSQAHPLGMAIYAATHDLHEAIDACASRCSGGCFHGVLTEALKEFSKSSGADESTPATFDRLVAHGKELCNRSDTAERLGSCAHGIGHAFTFLSGYQMAPAIAACRTFPEIHLQLYCASGAYMERDTAYGERDVAGPDPLAPCRDETEFPSACYAYKMAHLLRKSQTRGGQTLDQVATTCLGLTAFHRLGCFYGIGTAQWETVARFPDSLRVVCRYGGSDDQIVCIEGVISTLVHLKSPSAQSGCDRLPSILRTACRNAMRNDMYSLDAPLDRYVPSAASRPGGDTRVDRN